MTSEEKQESEEQLNQYLQKYANKQAIVESEDRINDIAKDMLKHYRDIVYPNGFKKDLWYNNWKDRRLGE